MGSQQMTGWPCQVVVATSPGTTSRGSSAAAQASNTGRSRETRWAPTGPTPALAYATGSPSGVKHWTVGFQT
jgi:hypothetical protein